MLRTTVDRSKLQHALVLRGFQRIGPQAGRPWRIAFHQRHLPGPTRPVRRQVVDESAASMQNIAAVAPYSGHMLEMVARSPMERRVGNLRQKIRR